MLESLAFGALLGAVLFGGAGTLAWPMAWAVLGVYAAFALAGFLLLPPELIAERSSLPPDTQRTDLLIATPASLLLIPGSLLVCALDARFGWTPEISAGVRALAFAVFALGYAISMWAAASNPFFAAVVRVQRERDHRVVTGGPYRFVRHPGYAGPIVAHLALPIALGSLQGLIPAAAGCLLLMLRVRYEERVLREGLEGYVEYTQRVRWRLLPGLW